MTLLDIQRLLTIVFEALSMFAGIITWRKHKGTVLNTFTIYLAVIVTCEITGNRLLYYGYKMVSNYLFTFFVIPIEFLFLFYLFYKLTKSKKIKYFIIISTTLIVISFLIEQFYLKNSQKYFFLSLFYSVSNILLLIIIFLFSLRWLQHGNIINYTENSIFWIITGLLLFYLGTFPLFAMFNTLWDLDKNLFRKYYSVQFILNWLMYLLFTIAFIWGKPKYLYSSF